MKQKILVLWLMSFVFLICGLSACTRATQPTAESSMVEDSIQETLPIKSTENGTETYKPVVGSNDDEITLIQTETLPVEARQSNEQEKNSDALTSEAEITATMESKPQEEISTFTSENDTIVELESEPPSDESLGYPSSSDNEIETTDVEQATVSTNENGDIVLPEL